jgi:hypothetical protein
LLTIDELDEPLTVYHDDDGWRRLTLPKLQAVGSRKVAEPVGISERRARDSLKGRAIPHAGHRRGFGELAVQVWTRTESAITKRIVCPVIAVEIGAASRTTSGPTHPTPGS